MIDLYNIHDDRSKNVVTAVGLGIPVLQQVTLARVASQVRSNVLESSHCYFFQVKSSQVISFPSSDLKSVWCSAFPFCKVTTIFRQLRGHLNDRTENPKWGGVNHLVNDTSD